MDEEAVFYWIGAGVVSTIAAITIAAVLFILYARYIHERFHLIFFRKGQRRLSIASWYMSRLISDEHYHADDFPIGERPFYLSYRIGRERRIFMMLGIVGPARHMAVSGEHPDEAKGTPHV